MSFKRIPHQIHSIVRLWSMIVTKVKGWKRHTLMIFKRQPSRQFQIPDASQLEKIYFILTSMYYEVIEQSLNQEEFHLVAVLEPSLRNVRQHHLMFKNSSISIKGKRDANLRWQIHLILHTGGIVSSSRVKYADLILEDITNALGWQTYWIIECPPPSNTTLAA